MPTPPSVSPLHPRPDQADRREIHDLRALIAAIACVKPGLLIPDHVMEAVDWSKLRFLRS